MALGLRSLDGFDWYARGAQILVDRQEHDGGWPHDRWGRLPSTCLALLFLRKANLAFEIDRVLRLPGPKAELTLATTTGAPETEASPSPSPPPGQDVQGGSSGADANGTAGADDVKVIVTGASQQAFPRIAVQFEVKRPDGTFLLDAKTR